MQRLLDASRQRDLHVPRPRLLPVLRDEVLPLLRTYPLVRVWHAGCSTGEEVYSMAILLQEEGLYGRCRIYATDMSEEALARRRRAFPARRHAGAHRATTWRGRARRPSRTTTRAQGNGRLRPRACGENMVFAQHNLVTDGSFNEFNLVLCRNVLIYFNRRLQDRVHRLLYESLGRLGFLALGARETVRFTPHETRYQDGRPQRIYRKVA